MTSWSAVNKCILFFASFAISDLPVAIKYSSPLESNGNIEQVAPISAPMLVIVAFPVVDIDSVPSPKYSTIAFVPPFTVSISATFKIMSFGEVHPLKEPVNFIPISFGIFVLKGIPAITSTASAPPTPIAIIPIPPAFGV